MNTPFYGKWGKKMEFWSLGSDFLQYLFTLPRFKKASKNELDIEIEPKAPIKDSSIYVPCLRIMLFEWWFPAWLNL